jgi:hypothetical protein
MEHLEMIWGKGQMVMAEGWRSGMLSDVQGAVSVGYSMDSETAQSATRTQARTGYERRNILMRIRSRDDYLRAREFCT